MLRLLVHPDLLYVIFEGGDLNFEAFVAISAWGISRIGV